jgi:3-oxoacyl-[acyl-carrier protein] reductase
MGSLTNKTALVTGASRGIGRATASALAEAGAHILVHYVAKTFPLVEAVDALRYLIEGRPFGRVILTI